MIKNINTKNQWIVCGSILAIILLAIVARFSTSLDNFAPFGALALFAGAYITNRRLAILLPLGGLFISDLAMEIATPGSGFYPEMGFIYAAYALTIVLGFSLKNNKSAYKVAGLSLLGSAIFFLVSNFGVWSMQNVYPHTTSGLVSCYTMAIPFIRNTVFSDLMFNAVLFGSAYLLFAKKAGTAKAA